MPTVFQRVGPYEILHEIGRGGMAVVFLATDSRTNQRVALRLVPAGPGRETEDVLEAERWGAKLQEQFCHVSKYVPTVYEHDTDDGYFYIAMEYLDGRNLSELIAHGPLAPDLAIAIAIQLSDFLESAHAFEATIDGRQLRSLLHGDLTPRNIRVLDGDQIKVLDFGIAKALSLSRKVTRNDFGNVAYLSPERLLTGEIDAQSDFWAVGVLLYEMIAGGQPFRAADTRLLEQRIQAPQPPPPLTAPCPQGLQAIVGRLLARNPSERYADARAIREDLERVRAGQVTAAQGRGWPACAADEATRRTRTPIADEATRRTVPPAVAPPPAATTPPPRAATPLPPLPPLPPLKPRRRRRRWFVKTMLLLFGLSIIGNELSLSSRARRLGASVPTAELDTVNDLWHRYDDMRGDGLDLRLGLAGLERSLVRRTSALAERVFANYRMPTPTVRETQWRQAREALQHAVDVRPDDASLKGALRYCEGHLHRINGDAGKARRESSDADGEFTEAVAAFREAAELRPDWPDPFLGLMRTFIYGLDDVDRGADALKQAEHLGYTAGDRETAQIADGYRARAESLSRTARTLVDMPQEHEYLTRAAEAYRQAIDLYSKAVGYADVARKLRAVQHGLDQVDERLGELR